MGNTNRKEAKPLDVINLNTTRHELQYPIFAIGSKYYLEEKEGVLHHTSIQMLKDTYSRKLTDEIQHRIGFINEPSHTNYQSTVDNKYNLYKRLTHIPSKGNWDSIELFLKHIFGDSYIMGLEYFWNLYHHPKQKLPFIGIVSEKKSTGKSTFLTFIRLIFQENVSVVSEHDFTSNFNSGFVNSLVCISDEHAEGKNRTKIAQRLKTYITEKQIRVEAKGRDSYSMLAFFKMVFAGNDEEMLTFIESENTRYWIIKIGAIDKVVFDMEAKLEAEIPHFLYFLINEFTARPSRGRLYFDPSEFQTESSKLIQENSISSMHRDIKDLVQTCLEENPKLKEVYFSPTDLVNSLGVKRTEKAYIANVLKKEMKLQPCTLIRYRAGDMIHSPTKNGTPYKFEREHFYKLA